MEPDNVQLKIEQTRFSQRNQVTPLSKYLALALLVFLPFVAGYIGYTLAPVKVVEIEKIVAQESNSETVESTESVSIESNSTKWDTLTLDLELNDFTFQYPSSWAVTDGGPETIVYVGDVNPIYFTKGKEYGMNNFVVHYGPGGCAGGEISQGNPLHVNSGVKGNDSLWQTSMVGECREIRFENGITISMSAYGEDPEQHEEKKEVIEKILSTFIFSENAIDSRSLE